MSTITSQLIVSLLDRVSAPSRAVARAVTSMRDRIETNNQKLDAMRGRMVEAAAVAYGLAQAISAPIKSAVEFESAMADLAKVTEFSDAGLVGFGKSLRLLSTTRIPMAVTELAALAAEAAAAGIAQDDLLGFTEMTAKAAVAWGVSGARAGEDLAKLQTALGLTVDQTSKYADAINYLSDKTASSATDLVDFSRRVASQGEFFGFSKEQTLAFGSAMVSAGAETEVAATTFSNMGKALTRGASATKAQRAAFKRLGLDSKKVSKAMQKDAVVTTLKVIEKLGQLPEHMRASTMSDLFGDEARALAPLLTNVDLLRKALGYVNDEMSYTGSVGREFEQRAKTTEFALQRFKNQMNDLGLTIGSILLPALNRIMEVLGPIATKLAEYAEAHPALTQAIIVTTAALVGLRVAALAAQFSLLWMRGAWLTAALGGLKSLAVGLATGRLAFLPFTRAASAARTAMVGFAAAASIGGTGSALRLMAGSLLGLLNPLRLVSAAFKLLRIAVVSTGIGAILLGIAAAGTWIYNNWSGIKEMFAGIAEGLQTAFPALGPIIDTVSTAVGTLFGWFDKLTGPISATKEEWRSFGVSIGTTVAEIVTRIAALPGQIAALAVGMVDAGRQLMNGLWEGIKQIMGEIVSYIQSALQNAFAGAAAKARQIASSLSFGLIGGDAPQTNPIPGRAAGGSIYRGQTYLVGEEGPELITAGANGYVHTAGETAQMMGGRSGGSAGAASGSGPISITMHNHGINDPEELSARMLQILERKLREKMSGIHADTTWAVR